MWGQLRVLRLLRAVLCGVLIRVPALLALLTPALPEAETEALTQAQSRLELALANLPGNPAGAALDLERAWDELDTILSARMGLPETAVNPTDTTGDTTETAVPTATPEPTPTP